MPIRQQRILDLLSAFESAQSARADLQTLVASAVALHRDGILSLEEMASQIKSAFSATQIPTHHVVTVARERQHFHDVGKRNEYAANRRAWARATARVEAKDAPAIQRMNRYSPEQLAMAQMAPKVNPTDLLVSAPTAEQLAADDAMMAAADEDEIAAHLAEMNKGLQ